MGTNDAGGSRPTLSSSPANAVKSEEDSVDPITSLLLGLPDLSFMLSEDLLC
eukprot:SAG31_NODE_2479_length_5631_cov_99.073325_2_plen_52_part_00